MINLSGNRSAWDGTFSWSCYTDNTGVGGYNIVNGSGPTAEAAVWQALAQAEAVIDKLQKDLADKEGGK